jgi:hypothetical protein
MCRATVEKIPIIFTQASISYFFVQFMQPRVLAPFKLNEFRHALHAKLCACPEKRLSVTDRWRRGVFPAALNVFHGDIS